MKCGNNSGYQSDHAMIAVEDDVEEDADNGDENLYPSDQERVIDDEERYTDICILCNMQPCCTIIYDDVIIEIISSCNMAYPKKEDGHKSHDMACTMTMEHFCEIPVCVVKMFNEEWGS